jgi:hypothetical protein
MSIWIFVYWVAWITDVSHHDRFNCSLFALLRLNFQNFCFVFHNLSELIPLSCPTFSCSSHLTLYLNSLRFITFIHVLYQFLIILIIILLNFFWEFIHLIVFSVFNYGVVDFWKCHVALFIFLLLHHSDFYLWIEIIVWTFYLTIIFHKKCSPFSDRTV